MLILAIDSSEKTLSVALVEDGSIRTEVFAESDAEHSVLLLPIIKRVYEIANLPLERTDLFVCTTGPGSFTGLRIAVCTIKGLAMTGQKPIIGLSTLEVLATQAAAGSFKRYLCPMLNAGKGQIYTAIYQLDEGLSLRRIGDEMITDVYHLPVVFTDDTLFLGSAALTNADALKDLFPKSFIAPLHDCHIRAGNVGLLGMKKFKEGIRSDVFTLTPRYLQASEAERKLTAHNVCRKKH